jgi:YD repeat-containing protein
MTRRMTAQAISCLVVALTTYVAEKQASAQCDCGTFRIYDRTETTIGLGECDERFFAATTYCCSGEVVSVGPFNCGMRLGTGHLECPPNCCPPTVPSCGGLGTITSYDCDTAAVNCSYPWCDGREESEETCFDNGECPSADKNPFPMRFSTGRVETNPIDVFSLPTPVDVPLGFIVRWGSHQKYLPTRWSTDTPPLPLITIDSQTNNYLGMGWVDIYSDRLYVHSPTAGESIPPNPPAISWQSFDLSRTFYFVSIVSGYGRYTTAEGDYELRDYGVGANPRFRIIRLRQLKVWEFSAYTFTSPQNNQGMIGWLTKISVPANATTFASGYYVTISRDTYGRMTSVQDPFGRRLEFIHSQPTSPEAEDPRFPHIDAVDLVAGAGASPVRIATLQYLDDASLLGAIHLEDGRRGDYYRFNYQPWRSQNGDVICETCRGLLAQVIVPTAEPGTSPAVDCTIVDPSADGCPVGDNEMVLEGHEFDEQRRAVLTYGPGARFGYVHEGVCGDEENPCMREFDLLESAPLGPGGPPPPSCSTGCPADFGCFDVSLGGDGGCYRYTDVTFDAVRQTVVSKTGNCPDCDVSYEYDEGRLVSVTSAGTTSSFSWGPDGQVGCIVRNDNNDEAGDAATGCDVPAGQSSYSVGFLYSDQPTAQTTTTQKVSPSVVPGGATTTETLVYDYNGRLKAVTYDGYTRNVAGNLVSQSRTTAYTYNSYGQLTKIDGPLVNSQADDRIILVYHSTGINDNGRLHEVHRHAGPSANFIDLVTKYENYDDEGIPRRIVDPSNIVTVLDTADRVTWTVTRAGATWEYVVNADGKISRITDPDGVDVIYTYGAPEFPSVGPTNIQIFDEIENIQYKGGNADRPVRVTRSSLAGYDMAYTYDARGRLTSQSSPHGVGVANKYFYQEGIISSYQDANCPGGTCGRTDFLVDALGRPTERRRYLDASNYISARLSYASGQAVLPTGIARGLGAATANSSNYTYDDFGELVEAVTPDHGTTRFQYDVAGNMTRIRVGVGTGLVRTTILTYDSVGRLLAVDNDSVHAVDCATAPAWAAISDEEYRYDDCLVGDSPAGFTCTNALGRRTMARKILSCNDRGAPMSEATWYSYDSMGRLSATASALKDDMGIGSPEVATFAYTPGSRLSSLGSPTSIYDTKYSYSSQTGRVTAVKSGPGVGTPLASSFEYESFGPMRAFRVSFGSGMAIDDEFAADYSPKNRSITPFFTFPPVQGYEMRSSYDAAGYLARFDVINSPSPQFVGSKFDHDAIGRISCEYGVGESSCPVSATSSGLRAKYTFFAGASSTQPPDNRATSVHRLGAYAPGIVDSAVYAASTNRIASLTRPGTGVGTTFSHDALGRRTSDVDDFAPTSRRDYTYLPDGRLGTISGTGPDGPYVFAFVFDADGRPAHVVKTVAGVVHLEYDLYYDLDDHLAFARVVDSRGASPITYRWTYHYVNGERFAATRERVSTGGTSVKRYALVNDQQGRLRRVVDDQNVQYFLGDYLASGWRNLVQQATETWFPFALPGQIVLDGTEAQAACQSGCSYSFTRPPIYLNNHREFDPFLGAFLQPDPADVHAREDSEGYLGMRGNSLRFTDESGDYSVDVNCEEMSPLIEADLVRAASGLFRCAGGQCFASTVSRAAAALLLSHIECPKFNQLDGRCGYVEDDVVERALQIAGREGSSTEEWSRLYTQGFMQNFGRRSIGEHMGNLGIAVNVKLWRNEPTECNRNGSLRKKCGARTLAHEALHLAGHPMLGGFHPVVAPFADGKEESVEEVQLRIEEHWNLNDIAEQCVQCR